MRIVKGIGLLSFFVFASLSSSAEPLNYEVTCRLYDLATTHILAEEIYAPNKDSASLVQFSFQEFQLRVLDQAIDQETRGLKLEIVVENQPSFDVSEGFAYKPQQIQRQEKLRLGHVWTEWPGVGNTLWLYCDAQLSKAP